MKDYAKAADAELIAACLEGEPQAWEALIERYQRLIYSIPYKYHLSPDDAADVFQFVCLSLLEKLDALRDETKLSSWLITTTMRECWKVKRQGQRTVIDLDDEASGVSELPSDEPLPDEILQTLEEQHLLRQGLAMMDERCKTLLRYLFYEKEEWSYEQISHELGMPVPSIGPTRKRCLDKLKRILKKMGLS
jgi:RNA polymerase sigma factor (sigma-70 family)